MFLILLAIGACTQPEEANETQCNGRDDLCERRYDQVVFPGTHNSMASEEDGFWVGLNANQYSDFGTQLQDGIRVFLLDIYEGSDGQNLLCHGPCELGSVVHVDLLKELADFVEENPREVISFLYQDSVSAQSIADDFEAAGLTDHCFAKEASVEWPTLAAMIDAGTTLLITTEHSSPPPDHVHNFWNIGWDTNYEWTEVDQFNCDLNRGDDSNQLLMVNHWLYTDLGLPDPARVAQANTFDSLFQHADGCRTDVDAIPNWLVVDFYEEGDLLLVVEALNEP